MEPKCIPKITIKYGFGKYHTSTTDIRALMYAYRKVKQNETNSKHISKNLELRPGSCMKTFHLYKKRSNLPFFVAANSHDGIEVQFPYVSRQVATGLPER